MTLFRALRRYPLVTVTFDADLSRKDASLRFLKGYLRSITKQLMLCRIKLLPMGADVFQCDFKAELSGYLKQPECVSVRFCGP